MLITVLIDEFRRTIKFLICFADYTFDRIEDCRGGLDAFNSRNFLTLPVTLPEGRQFYKALFA